LRVKLQGVKIQQKQSCFRYHCNNVRKTATVVAEIVAVVAIKIISERSASFVFNTGLLENLFLIRSYGDDNLQTESCKKGPLNSFWNKRSYMETSPVNFRGFLGANFMTSFFAPKMSKFPTLKFYI